jgi:general secretion pathway protein E
VIDFSVTYLLGLLEKRGMLNAEQIKQIRHTEAAVRATLLKERAGVQNRRSSQFEVSPVEILTSYEFVTADGKVLDEDLVMTLIAEDANVPWVKPDPLKLNADLIAETMTRPFARRHTCVPLRKDDGKVVIAVENPYDEVLIQQLKDVVRAPVQIVVSARSDIQRIITEVYGFRTSISAAAEGATSGLNVGNLEQLVKLTNVGEIEATDKPVVNAVEYLLHYALDQRASDIHIEPKREHSVVRLRIDGVLHNIYTLPRVVHPAFVSRLKMLSRMDIAEKR